MFNSINEVYSWLYVQKKLNKRENLERIAKAINLLNIKTDYKIIHIAGTNGKGSTAQFTKNILKHTGNHVGMFISPFVVSFNERIQINDRYISDSEIMFYANKLKSFSDDYYAEYQDVIPFFELTLLMALMFFEDRNIDIAVIECGLGGLLDPTNVLKTDLAVITNIGFDHMQSLGDTLEKIAIHKLGIVKKNMTLLTTVDYELVPQFSEYVKSVNGSLVYLNDRIKDISVSDYTYFTLDNVRYKASLLGIYQAYNASLAIEACKYIMPNISDEIIQYELLDTVNPGRFEHVTEMPIYLDGAHNIHGIGALKDTIKVLFKDKSVKIVFSALHDKLFKEMISLLDEVTDKYYFTTLDDSRATNPELFKECTSIASEVILNPKECLEKAINELDASKEILLVTGSLHFISVIRALIKELY